MSPLKLGGIFRAQLSARQPRPQESYRPLTSRAARSVMLDNSESGRVLLGFAFPLGHQGHRRDNPRANALSIPTTRQPTRSGNVQRRSRPPSLLVLTRRPTLNDPRQGRDGLPETVAAQSTPPYRPRNVNRHGTHPMSSARIPPVFFPDSRSAIHCLLLI